MKRIALLIIMTALLAGCGGAAERDAATPLPPAPTAALSIGEALAPVAPTAPPAETAVDAALPAAPVAPTAAPTTEAPSLAPSPTDEPPLEVSLTDPSPTAEFPSPEPTSVSLFGPGQQDGTSLVAGEAVAYLVDGRPFQPLILFVEPGNELNVTLAAYVGDQTGQTMPEGVMPVASADNTLTGRPEILVLSPESNGLYTLVIRAAAGEGSFVAHLFDLTTPARGIAVQQADTLEAGAEKTYEVASNGPRPVIVAADPGDQSDIAVDILADDGTMLTTANYSGPGGVETAYVLPLGATTYTVKVREANGGPSAFQIVIIALE